MTLILTFVQNFVKLLYLEFTCVEMSYLSVFGLSRSIIYRADELFIFFFRFCISSWSLTLGENFMIIHPVVKGAVLYHLPVKD